MKAKNGKVSAAKSMKLHRLYLVNPKKNIAMDKLAESIVSLKFVQEMFLEDHSKGLLVKIRFFPGFEPENIADYLSSKLKRKFCYAATG